MWRKHLQKATPADFCAKLASLEQLMEQAFIGCTAMRKGILAAAFYQGYDITFTQLDTISTQDYPQDDQAVSPITLKALQLGHMKTRFSIEVLEKERRWIFKKLQEQCTLTNVERLHTQMISELCARPEFDVIGTPLSSCVWDPIIQAYLKDVQRLDPLIRIL